MKRTSGTRLRPGDVLEAECVNGIGLMTYVGRHPHFGDLLWVVPQRFPARPVDVCTAVENGYFQFYPATASARAGLIHKIGFCTGGMRVIPRFWRNMINRNDDGTIRTWLVCDEHTRAVREQLSEDERALPIGEIVNHPILLARIEEGWTPSRYERAF